MSLRKPPVNRLLCHAAKSLKNGAGYRIRTHGPLITNHNVALFSLRKAAKFTLYRSFSLNNLARRCKPSPTPQIERIGS